MKRRIKEYFETLKDVSGNVVATGLRDKGYSFEDGLYAAINTIVGRARSGGKLFVIGNGASASIASHMAVDFWKNAGIKAFSFNDAVTLTCLSNDYGYRHVFEKPICVFGDKKALLIAISSSGQSENILRAAIAAKEKGIRLITLSGFKKNNPLRKLGHINFYAPASHYGYVEVVHSAICHCMIDMIANHKSKL